MVFGKSIIFLNQNAKSLISTLSEKAGRACYFRALAKGF